jgi:hypothetical protein
VVLEHPGVHRGRLPRPAGSRPLDLARSPDYRLIGKTKNHSTAFFATPVLNVIERVVSVSTPPSSFGLLCQLQWGAIPIGFR